MLENNNRFYTISNSDGKKWSIPCNNSNMGFEIYEPSNIKGRLLKKCCFLLKLYCVRCLAKVKVETIVIDSDTREVIEKCFGKPYQISVFYGTPCTDQKTTIQVFRNNDILGYVKIGYSKRTKSLFDHEYDILKYLENQGVRHVPRALYKSTEGSKSYFIQTTEKTKHSLVAHTFNIKHDLFLKNLYEKTKQKVIFNNTALYQALEECVSKSVLLSITAHKAVISAFNKIWNKYEEKNLNWGVVHGDFTPWNTCVINEDLFVFDFEYSLRNGPSKIDYWHFVIQSLVYERRMGPVDIADYLLKREEVSDYSSDSYYELLIYLLYFMSIYLLRGEAADIEIAESRATILVGVMPKED